jgi:hypothetical protein
MTRLLIRRRLGLTLLAAGLCAAPFGAAAQAWPAKPIRIIVPYTPGGSSDIIARAISQPLSQALPQGAEVYTMTPPEFAQFFERERAKWAAVVTKSGVKLD